MLKDESKSQEAIVEAYPENNESPSLQHTLEQFDNCADLVHRTYPKLQVDIVYFSPMMDMDKLTRDVLTPCCKLVKLKYPACWSKANFPKVRTASKSLKGFFPDRQLSFTGNPPI